MTRLASLATLLALSCLLPAQSFAQSTTTTTTTTTAKDGSTVTVTVTRKKARRLSAEEIAELREKKKKAEAKAKQARAAGSQAAAVTLHQPPTGPLAGGPPPAEALLARPTAPQGDSPVVTERAAISQMVDPEADLSPKEMEATPWSLRLEANTDMPLHLGAGLLLETPARFRVRTGFGFISKAYVSGANALVQGLSDSYDEQDAALVESALGQSFLWRNQVGIRPFRSAGFYLHAGYSLAKISGSASGFDVVDAAFNLNEREREAMMRLIEGNSSVEIDSTLHMLDGELGWEWWPSSHISLRIGLGWAYTMAASASLSVKAQPQTDAEEAVLAQIEEEGSQKLSELYTAYFHPPSLNIALGLRF